VCATIEFNNEPDVDAEWKGGRVPVNGLDLTVENTIANLELVLERGGMPAIPAVANGSRWDLVGRIVAAGHRDLLDGPVWQAIHNYAGNRPLDYPYDIGNQEGGAFTERFFRTLAGEAWGEDAWRGRSLLEVNRLRYDRRNPGATIADDHACCWPTNISTRSTAVIWAAASRFSPPSRAIWSVRTPTRATRRRRPTSTWRRRWKHAA
jgi:hypothetical protein